MYLALPDSNFFNGIFDNHMIYTELNKGLTKVCFDTDHSARHFLLLAAFFFIKIPNFPSDKILCPTIQWVTPVLKELGLTTTHMDRVPTH